MKFVCLLDGNRIVKAHLVMLALAKFFLKLCCHLKLSAHPLLALWSWTFWKKVSVLTCFQTWLCMWELLEKYLAGLSKEWTSLWFSFMWDFKQELSRLRICAPDKESHRLFRDNRKCGPRVRVMALHRRCFPVLLIKPWRRSPWRESLEQMREART